MLRRVPANAVNARVLEADDHIIYHILDICIFTLQIRHAPVLLRGGVAAVVAAVGAEIMEIGGFVVFENAVDAVRQITVIGTGDMVGNHVDDDLHAVLVRFGTQGLQIAVGAQLVADREVGRLVQPVPFVAAVMRLQGRGLYAGKARRRDVRQLRLDLAERPVKALQDVAVRTALRQTVFGAGIGDICILRRYGKTDRDHTGQDHTYREQKTDHSSFHTSHLFQY